MSSIGAISPIYFSSLGPRHSALSTKRISTWKISPIFLMIFLSFAVPAKASLPPGIDTLQVYRIPGLKTNLATILGLGKPKRPNPH